MTTRTKMAVSFIAVAVGFAILQTVMGLFWESERMGWGLVPAGLAIGCLYLFYFFLYSRRHLWIGLLITLGVAVGIVAVSMVASNEPASSIFTGWTIPATIRVVYFIVISQVADHFAKPIHNKKVADQFRKQLAEMGIDTEVEIN